MFKMRKVLLILGLWLGMSGAGSVVADQGLLEKPTETQVRTLVGVWEGQQVNPVLGLATYVQTVLQPGGSYTFMAQAGNLLTRHWGKYDVGQGFIRFNLEGGKPKEWCGPLGCQEIVWPEEETIFFQWLDANTIQTHNGLLRRVK